MLTRKSLIVFALMMLFGASIASAWPRCGGYVYSPGYRFYVGVPSYSGWSYCYRPYWTQPYSPYGTFHRDYHDGYNRGYDVGYRRGYDAAYRDTWYSSPRSYWNRYPYRSYRH